MSFVPVTGPATLLVGEPPREGVGRVHRRAPHRRAADPGALPVLGRAHDRDDVHPSVALLAGAALLGMRLVAAGKFEPRPRGPAWRVAGLDAADERPRRRAGRARGPATASTRRPPRAWSAAVLDAVADAMPRSAPRGARATAARRAVARPAVGAAQPRRVQRPAAGADRPHRARGRDDRPQLVTLSLRVEADEEELVAGAVRLVLQVHDEHDPLHVCDAALLWTERGPDATPRLRRPGPHPRRHRAARRGRRLAGARPAARAAGARRDHPRRRRARRACSRTASAALTARGVDVLWPRSLGRDLTASRPCSTAAPAGAARGAADDGAASARTRCSPSRWQVALHGDPLTDDEMDAAGRAPPARCSGCAATGSWSTPRSRARPASG